MPYYRVMQTLIYQPELMNCLPPYDELLVAEGFPPCPDYEAMFNYFSRAELDVPPVHQCFVGVFPYTCPVLKDHDIKLDEFFGYPFEDEEDGFYDYGALDPEDEDVDEEDIGGD